MKLRRETGPGKRARSPCSGFLQDAIPRSERLSATHRFLLLVFRTCETRVFLGKVKAEDGGLHNVCGRSHAHGSGARGPAKYVLLLLLLYIASILA